MVDDPLSVVLDTNIFVSSLVYGGKPENIIKRLLNKQFIAITSPPLLAELTEILTKKFAFSFSRIRRTENLVKKHCKLVYPRRPLHVLADEADNRVLEAAIEEHCQVIVTGDQDLLHLKVWGGIKILTASEF